MQDTPPDHMNEVPSVGSYLEVPSEAPASNSYGIKTDSRTESAVLLSFHSVAAETPKAICLSCTDYKQGIVVDTWLPKKLCSNMNTVDNTVNVWDVLFNEHKSEFLEPSTPTNEG